ncbi:Transcriptional activator protein CopR [Gammaproteobacteria bacterium]|nr:Transcriptional activator protein CopR [Gammaproteobacteria bacterium]
MRLLVVEDERQIASFLERGLKEEGYAVDVVYNGNDALDWTVAVEYDAIVLDVLLPGRDGFSVCRELRARGSTTPVLMLTARDAVDDRVNGLDSGADDYLVKPFAFKELLARLRAVTRRQSDSRTTDLRLADLTLNTLTHTAQRGERRIELTTKEYNLLEFLMRNPNRVLSRTQIAEHVWNLDFVAESNVVDVYIRYLRRKIDDDAGLKLIKTVRGSGYLISDASD